MKSLLQMNHRRLNNHAGLLLPIFILIAFMNSGCKKEIAPPCDQAKFDGKNAVTIVHSGQSIQAAIDGASAGTIIYIEPGIYKEALTVNKSNIQLIGSACNLYGKVIIENPGDEDNGIVVNAGSDGFVLRNVTVQNFEENGVLLTGVDNFILSHVSAVDDGEYGLFPIHCTHGLIEDCFATGHEDTGIYVGQCSGVAIQNNEVTANVNGIEIENSSDVAATKNHSYNNVSGILIDLLPGLAVKTASGVLIDGNNIESNNHVNFGNPEEGFEAFVPSGSGILLVGVDNVTIKNNRIVNNNFTGVATVSTVILGALAGLPPSAFSDIEPNPDNAKIVDNVITGNGSAPPAGLPLPGVDLLWDGNGTGNCWKNNTHNSEYPSPLPSCN